MARFTALLAGAVLALIAAYLAAGLGGDSEVAIGVGTTLYTTGLAGEIASLIEGEAGIEVSLVPGPSGRLLEVAARGDLCLVVVHAPGLEASYLREGSIVRAGFLAYNYFVVVGPPGDPAGVRGSPSVVEAFKRIYMSGSRGEALFVSRGDHSGTHERELLVWRLAGVDPGGDWYIASGGGAYNTLLMAEEEGAYTLVDEATYYYMRYSGLIDELTILYEGRDRVLANIYSVYYSSSCPDARDLGLLIAERAPGVVEGFLGPGGVKAYYTPSDGLDSLWRELAGLGGVGDGS